MPDSRMAGHAPSPWDLPYTAHLYLHVPFCLAKCRYCDFVSYAGREAHFAPYVRALCREIALVGPEGFEPLRNGPAASTDSARCGPSVSPRAGLRRPQTLGAADSSPEGACISSPAVHRRATSPTVYIGGGTPTVLPPAGLEAILRACHEVLDLAGAEITVEANPGTISYKHIRVLRDLGVNRLSLGVQSFSEDALRLLGRIHTAAEADQALTMARQAGLDHVNLDLIFGLPGQSLAAWQEDLEEALRREPEHLSLYGLTLEEGTPLAEDVACGRLPLPDEDLGAEMYLWAEERLEAAGYGHYEISNWARLGCWSRHNIAYWRNEEYVGCGVAAHSHRGRRRWANTRDVGAYIAALEEGVLPVAEAEEVDEPTAMGETMMLGLRLLAGVPRAVFAARYGVELEAVYGAIIAELAGQGLLAVDEVGIRLTQRGRLLGNQVFMRFLPGEDC
jgi:oxygen-independent coproporphyrinogen-3 oxidase